MANRTIELNETIYRYLIEATLREDDLLRELREETWQMEDRCMQIAPEQGQFMGLMVELMGARLAVEVGTFTGYSSICVARALPPTGRLIACDASEEWTATARKYWKLAGLETRVELRLGPGIESLESLLAEGLAGQVDFAFIDADKVNYPNYFDLCFELLRPGGLIAIDNALRDGDVADPENNKPETVAIRNLNAAIREDDRVSCSLVPIGDGVMLARKR
jgi:predicted O-methyltransferase YrrM